MKKAIEMKTFSITFFIAEIKKNLCMSPIGKSDRTYYFWWPQGLQSQAFGLTTFDLASFTERTGYLKDSPFFILNIFPF